MADLEGIYRRYGLQVLRRCRRILRNDADAEDAAHEVFVRALAGLPEAEEEAMAFLYRVSTNLCLNRLRDRARRERGDWRAEARAVWAQVQGGEVDGTGDARARGEPERAALERELVLRIARDVEPETLALGIYYWVDGMSQGEIAEVVGLARGTVNRKLGELASTLRARLEEALR